MKLLKNERFEWGGQGFYSGLFAPEEESAFCPVCGAELGWNGTLYRKRENPAEAVGCGECVERVLL